MKKFLLIISHGSRSEEAAAEFIRIVDEVRRKSDFDIVEGAYMEFTEPKAIDMLNAMAGKNPDRIIVAPYYLFKGIHVIRDVQKIVNESAAKHPAVEFLTADPIGYEPMLADIVIKRAKEAAGE